MPLYITTTPGTTVTDNTTVDASVLNLIATPTVDIQGTLDGESTISIGAGAVSNSMLANMTGPKLKGKETGTGAPEDISISSELQISSATLGIKASGITSSMIADGAVTAAKINSGVILTGSIEAQPALTLAANVSPTQSVPPEPVNIGSGFYYSGTRSEISTSTRSRTSNVSTIVTGSAHGLSTGDRVDITGMTDTTFNLNAIAVTVTNSTTFTYTNTGSNVSSGSDTGGKVKISRTAAGAAPSTLNASGHVKAFISFDGTTVSPTLYGSGYNVSSVTKNATGDYTIVFTTAVPSNYVASCMCNRHTSASSTNYSTQVSIYGDDATALDTSQIRVIASSSSDGSLLDLKKIHVVIFGVS